MGKTTTTMGGTVLLMTTDCDATADNESDCVESIDCCKARMTDNVTTNG